MATCAKTAATAGLELPGEFEDLEGLLRADLAAIVGMIADRAGDRLLMGRREQAALRRELWDRLAGAINEAVEPLTADRR